MRSFVALACALVLGTALDDLSAGPPERRGDYYVLEADLHVHTRISDGFMSALEVPFAARRAALDVVAITDHNTVMPSKVARWLAKRTEGPIVITGEELTTSTHHVIALGLERTVPAELPLARALLEIHRQGGVAIAAHPGERYWDAYAPVMSMLDGAEVGHPVNRWREGRGEAFEAFYARLAASRPRPAAIASSDLHAMNGLGSMRTLVFSRTLDGRGVIEALRAGRTVVVTDDERMIGDAEMVSLLEAAPIAASPPPSYVAADLGDALARTLALVALALIVFVRRASLLTS